MELIKTLQVKNFFIIITLEVYLSVFFLLSIFNENVF